MKLSQRQEFPATPQRVFAMLTDAAFLRHAAAELGSPDARVTATDARTDLEVTVDAPPEVRRFVGDRLPIHQEVAWHAEEADGSRAGAFTITVPGMPVIFAGSVRLQPTASGSAVDHEGDLTVRIRLLGARIEKEAAPAILEALDAQARVGRAWLSR